GRTTPSVTGSRNLLECQLVASGPVSDSPSPTTQATIRSGLSYAAPYACEIAYPSSPPSWIEPGVSGATWLGIPPGKEHWVKRRFMPSSSLGNVWVDFAIGALEVGVGDQARAAVSGAGDVKHVKVVLLD